jgi:nucleoside-diphosphate-sugar epimerase
VFARLYGLETVALRYFNVFGPRQDPGSQYSAVIPKFIKSILNGERPTIYGDGEQTRDFTFVANVVDANIRAATAACTPGLAMNCACHDRVSLNRLVSEINSLLGTSIQPLYAGVREGDIKHSFAAIGLAQKEIGYTPIVEFKAGLQKTVEWYKERFGPPDNSVKR